MPWMKWIRRKIRQTLEKKWIPGLSIGFIVGFFFVKLDNFRNGAFGVLIFSWFNVLIIGIITTLFVLLDKEIKPIDIMTWSWISIRRNMVKSLLIVLVIGVTIGLL